MEKRKDARVGEILNTLKMSDNRVWNKALINYADSGNKEGKVLIMYNYFSELCSRRQFYESKATLIEKGLLLPIHGDKKMFLLNPKYVDYGK